MTATYKILWTQIKRMGIMFLTFMLIMSVVDYAYSSNPSGKSSSVDIGLFYSACGEFEVRAQPNIDLTNTSVTNIQFTIKWPENTVQLTNFASTFGLTQQGPVLQDGGYNYAIFVSAIPIAINWTAGQEYLLLSFLRTDSGNSYADFVLSDDSFTGSNNGLVYFEILGLDETGVVYHQATNTYLGTCGKIDGGIFNTACGEYEVRLKPHDDYLNNNLTNIQFTISWPANTVTLINFNSSYALQQQGPLITVNDTNYLVFVSATGIPINWIAETEYTVLTFSHDQSGIGYADFIISDNGWTQTNNGVFYVELLGLDYTGIIYNQALNTYIGQCGTIDIGLFNNDCAAFEVRLKPHVDYPDNALTNVQFTVKWPSSTVNLINFSSGFGVTQQGPVVIENDTNYAIFVSATAIPVNWTAETEYTILTFSHDQTSEGYSDFLIDTLEWSVINNGVYYVELLGLDNTGIVYNNAMNTYVGPCGIVDIKVILQGGYNSGTGLMNNAINLAGNLPNNHPYNTAPWNYTGIESLTVFPDSIVDWVIVELRAKTDESLVIETRVGLLSQTGIVMDTNLTRGIGFPLLSGLDSFYIVVLHRNHMPVMSGEPVSLPNFGAPYDFAEVVITQPYKHLDPLPVVLELDPSGSGIYGMIAGDINADGLLKYIGGANDRGLILQRITNESGLPYLHTVITGYFNEDITLDNEVKYIGTSNDRALILLNLIKLTGLSYLNSVYYSVVP